MITRVKQLGRRQDELLVEEIGPNRWAITDEDGKLVERFTGTEQACELRVDVLAKARLEQDMDRIYHMGPACAFSKFLHTVAMARARGNTPEQRMSATVKLKMLGSSWVEKAALNEASGVQGGYLVPPQLVFTLLKSLAEKAFVYERALKVPLDVREAQCPTVKTDTTGAAGTSPFQGGMSFTWGTSEGAALAETEPQFSQLNLLAQDLTGYAKVSNQLLADITPEGEKLLIELFARAAAWQADYGFLRGQGADGQQPIGMLNSNACLSVARASGNQVAVADIASMAALLIPEAWVGAVWATNPTTLAQLVKLAAFQLTQPQEGQDAACVGSLVARPLYITEKLPALGTFGDLMLFDPTMYVVGERSEVLIDADPHSAFQNNQTLFRVWLRLAGQPWLDAPVLLADGVTKASSIVALK